MIRAALVSNHNPLALAQNERDRGTGVPRAQIVHRFGCPDQVDRGALARLVRSISRLLDPADAVVASSGEGDGEVRVLDSRAMGSSWLADRLWERLGIGETIIAAAGGRRVEGPTAAARGAATGTPWPTAPATTIRSTGCQSCASAWSAPSTVG